VLFADLILFAQRQGGGGGGGEAAAAGGIVITIAMGCAYFAVFALQIAYVVWFFMTTYKVLNACSPRNRDMEPGMVFLMFIPLFSVIWIFFIIFRISSSLEKEFRSRGLPRDGDFGATLGLWGIISNLLCCAPVGIILNIMWLMKLGGYTKTLSEGGSRRSVRDDDDDDDRPRRRRDRDDDDD
jgi:hypothetical protein